MRNRWLLGFITALTITALPCAAQRTNQYGIAPGTSLTGPPTHGFALSLTADSRVYYLGSPILVTVEVRNVSGRPHVALFGSPNLSYGFQIVNALTKTVVGRNEHSEFGFGRVSVPLQGGWPMPVGTSMYGKFRLDMLYNFRSPGIYSVQVTKGMPVIDRRRVMLTSNAIHIIVLP
jgi:hypothetical protein